MTVSIPDDLKPDPSKPLRITGWVDSRLSTNPDRPDQLLIDWSLSRPLTEFEVYVIKEMDDDDPDVVFTDGSLEVIHGATKVYELIDHVVELDRRLQVIERAAKIRQEKHDAVLASAREALRAMNWE